MGDYAPRRVSVIDFTPIAAQLARSISLHDLLPRDAVDEVVPSEKASPDEPEEGELPADVQPFFDHFCAVTRAAFSLLAAPAFSRLADFHERIQEQYLPGGPPRSPIYDSFATQYVLSAVPQGVSNETPCSVLARLLLRDPSRARLQKLAHSLAEARFELYRVKSAQGHGAELEPVRGGDALRVRLTGPFLRTGDFGLMRVLPFDDQLFIADSPYLLVASEDDWRDHLARVVARQQAASPASAPQKASTKLSSKEQARRRQKEKERASRHTPEEITRRYLKLGLSDRYWFDYIVEAYAGERRGIVRLAGVPDKPELLPHAAPPPMAAPFPPQPLAEFREALLVTAANEGLFELALQNLARLCEATDTPRTELSPNEEPLLAAYVTLGLRAEDGTTALMRFERSRGGAGALHPRVRAFVEGIKNGWFTVVRVDHIHLDEGLEVFDLLREEHLQIRERTATRQLAPGDLLLGWLCKDRTGVLTLEGGLTQVPRVAVQPVLPLIAELRRHMPPLDSEQEWKEHAADLPLPLLTGIIALRANRPVSKGKPRPRKR